MTAKRSILLGFGLLLGMTALWSDATYTVDQVLFLPPIFYVGDHVELRVRIHVESGGIPLEPSELPPPTWIHIRDVRVIPIVDDYDIRISFSSYEPGNAELPPITLGDVILTGLKIETQSTVGDGIVKIEDAYDPMLLPGTRLLIAVAIGGILILPLALLFSSMWLRSFVSALVLSRKERRPWKTLNQYLLELRNRPSPVNNREFYIGLSDSFKKYLSRRLDKDYASLTSSELQRSLAGQFDILPAMANAALELSRFDMVKFGGKKVSPARRSQDLSVVRDAATALEEHLANQRMENKRSRRNRRVDT